MINFIYSILRKNTFTFITCSLIVVINSLISCNTKPNGEHVIVYRYHCNGCVEKNFKVIANSQDKNNINVIIDTSDFFVNEVAKNNNITVKHLSYDEITKQFGDYANVVYIDRNGKVVELRTDEIISFN